MFKYFKERKEKKVNQKAIELLTLSILMKINEFKVEEFLTTLNDLMTNVKEIADTFNPDDIKASLNALVEISKNPNLSEKFFDSIIERANEENNNEGE